MTPGTKDLVQVRPRRRVRKPIKPALLGNRTRRLHETAPGRARQRATETDASNAEIGEVLHGQVAVPADQHVHGLRRDRGDDSTDFVARSDAKKRVRAL